MKALECIIIDDEPLAREGVEFLVNETNALSLKGQFGNALAANDFLQQHSVDLMFLDIQMPGMTGIEFLSALKVPPLTIITTAYSEFALKGYELDVVDYLLKPIRKVRFLQSVNKAQEIFSIRDTEPNFGGKDDLPYTYISADRTYHKVYFKDIIYIEGMKDYVSIYQKDSRINPAMNLKTILKQLAPQTFARVNKSFIINVDYIQKIETDYIILPNKEIPLGRTYKEDFINRFVKGNLLKR